MKQLAYDKLFSKHKIASDLSLPKTVERFIGHRLLTSLIGGACSSMLTTNKMLWSAQAIFSVVCWSAGLLVCWSAGLLVFLHG